jgi:hypothetical protein
MNDPIVGLRRKSTLSEAIFLGFCATFIIITRAGLRLHLNLPGHAMFFTIFFLVLAGGCVPKIWTSTFVGLVAGIIVAFLGMGKGGPLLIVAKFILPGIIIDFCRIILPKMATSQLACVIVGMIASASRFLTLMATDRLFGLEWTIIMEHALISSLLGMLFGGLGALMVPPIVRRLKAHGLLFESG